MNQPELDTILQVIENPVRRRIIKRLSQEPCYALQLSKELGLGQPLVAKHLAVMESAGLVTSVVEESPSGPKRKRYSLARGISITMDVGPHLFMERGTAFEAAPKSATSRAQELRGKVQRAAQGREAKERLTTLSEVLDEVDRTMLEIQRERMELLQIRDLAMREAAKITSGLEGFDKKRVLFHILDEHDMDAERISESLNMRELAVRAILAELERDFFG